MSDKRAALDALRRLALARELTGLSGKAFADASWSLRKVEDKDLRWRARRLPEEVGDVIRAVLDGEPAPGLAELEAAIPPGLFKVAQVKGLGPKKVKQLWDELGITDLAELEYAIHENRLRDLKGFGAKTQDKVAESLAQLRAWEGFARRDTALAIVAAVQREVGPVEVLGALARGWELVESVEVGAPGLAPRTIDGGIPVHLHPIDGPVDRVRLTSDAEHFAALQARARTRGLALSEHALLRDGAAVALDDDDALYAELGLPAVPVERREGSALPAHAQRLVRRSDLRGALHNHTVASDGSGTLEQMREAAAQRGLSWLGISDHSQTADYAGGLDASRLRAQWGKVRALNAEDHAVRLFTGVESDILADGALDYPDDVLGEAEVVIASVHHRYGHAGEVFTERLCRAVRHPAASVWGHPTGRLLLGRAPSDFDMEAVLQACVEAGIAVELNASPHRLDLGHRWLGLARELGLMVSIAADAHGTHELDNLEHGVAVARRAGLGPEQVLNTRSADELLAWQASRR